jgi:hypothetical protein
MVEQASGGFRAIDEWPGKSVIVLDPPLDLNTLGKITLRDAQLPEKLFFGW